MKAPFTTNDLFYYATPTIYKQGITCYLEDLVLDLKVVEEDSHWTLSGTVQEKTTIRSVQIMQRQGEVTSSCSCLRQPCRHVVAVGYACLVHEKVEKAQTPAVAPAEANWRARLSKIVNAPEPISPEPISYLLRARKDHTLVLEAIAANGHSSLNLHQITSQARSPVDRAIASEISSIISAARYGYGYSYQNPVTAEGLLVPDNRVDLLLRTLALSDRVHNDEGRALSIAPHAPISLSLNYEKNEEGATLQPQALLDGTPINPESLLKFGSPSVWGFYNGTFHPLRGFARFRAHLFAQTGHQRSPHRQGRPPGLQNPPRIP